MSKRITAPLSQADARKLSCGDAVLINGVLYTARDAAHKRMAETLERGEELPFPIQDAVLYYTGPTPAKPGQVIGSAGPTTSGRMDSYTPALLDLGCRAMIGKGGRSQQVIDAIVRNGAVYFGATGGAGALLARCVGKAEVVAYEDLGAEAVFRLEVADFPAVVVIDSAGNNLYQLGPRRYLQAKG